AHQKCVLTRPEQRTALGQQPFLPGKFKVERNGNHEVLLPEGASFGKGTRNASLRFVIASVAKQSGAAPYYPGLPRGFAPRNDEMDMLDWSAQTSQAREWFESLRDRICAAFEEIERDTGSDAAFEYIAWDRE